MTEGSGTSHTCIACGYETILWDPDAEFACPECDEEILLTQDQAEAVRRDRQERDAESLNAELLGEDGPSAVVAIQDNGTIRSFRGMASSYTYEVSHHSTAGLPDGDTLSLDMVVTDIAERDGHD